MSRQIDILSMGEPMVEFNQTREGGGDIFLRGCGGDASNFAVAAARQGASVGYISAVGADTNGALLRALWRSEGVDDTYVKTHAQAPTGVYFVSHIDKAINSISRVPAQRRAAIRRWTCLSRRSPPPRCCISPASRSAFRRRRAMPVITPSSTPAPTASPCRSTRT